MTPPTRHSHGERPTDGWCVQVYRYGELVVTIEERMLAGKPDITEADADLIRLCADHLHAFAGDKPESLCVCGHPSDIHGSDGTGACGATRVCRSTTGCKQFRPQQELR